MLPNVIISRLRKHSVSDPSFSLDGQLLERVSSYTYLGVLIADNLSWSAHIDVISSKARKLIDLVYHKFSTYSQPKALLQLYASLPCQTALKIYKTSLEPPPPQTYKPT